MSLRTQGFKSYYKGKVEFDHMPFYLFVVPENCELVFSKDGRKAFAVVSPRSNPSNSKSPSGFEEVDSKRHRMEIKTSSRQISSEKFSNDSWNRSSQEETEHIVDKENLLTSTMTKS
jgi:hypothetical protein